MALGPPTIDPELYTAAKHCAKAHLAQLQSTEEFLHLPHRLLTDIISGKLREGHLTLSYLGMTFSECSRSGERYPQASRC